ncbi:hypothetical protein [Heyndrickxia coagulans]|uniref:hypothetical protein n=1 Tax=Heyndrickxia coagulans TaxID=1398 RepID=UPI0022357477|nr:hypothetical protein [Heyndrickxia coagulans]UZH06371.1 hypothetical protein ONG97_00030 [Heyndrickxia coagulans]
MSDEHSFTQYRQPAELSERELLQSILIELREINEYITYKKHEELALLEKHQEFASAIFGMDFINLEEKGI